jgi:hypothetical protein
MIFGAAVFTLSLAGALLNREPFDTWFYVLAWWSYILFVDGCVQRRRGESLLLSHPARFTFFSIFSVALWFIFEAVNLRLGNWSYQGLPADPSARWAGYVLGFATVVPAIMETADLLDTAEFMSGGHVKPLGWQKRVSLPFIVVGILGLGLPLLWPSVFFPLLWVAFAFLLEPLNERLGAPSLITDWREGSLKRIRVLLAAGLLCGILWEAWNMPAGARWVYHLPGMEKFKIFEMPLPGYLGFPFFAVEVFVMSSTALALWERTPRPLKAFVLAAVAAFVYLMCGLVDKFSLSPVS